MSLTNEEKELIKEALSVYVQLVARQAPQEQVQQIAVVAQGLIKKIDTLGATGDKSSGKPPQISDEWFEQVCKSCDKLSNTGCLDKVTEKFPGKCDPILHYERRKSLKNG